MAQKKDASVHSGHRERLRERVRSEGLESFSEHEVLELLLTYAIPQRDVNPLAHELVRRFGSLSGVLNADEAELTRVPGVGRQAALLLTLTPQLMRYYQLNALGERPVIVNLAQAQAYCMPLFLGAHEEQLFEICLDQSGHVLHRTLLHVGTIDEVAFYPRMIAREALRWDAHGVLLAHNHPSGTAEPSEADLLATKEAAAALHAVGVKLVDHLIFSSGAAYSIVRARHREGPQLSYVAPPEQRPEGGALHEEGDGWLCLTAEDFVSSDR